MNTTTDTELSAVLSDLETLSSRLQATSEKLQSLLRPASSETPPAQGAAPAEESPSAPSVPAVPASPTNAPGAALVVEKMNLNNFPPAASLRWLRAILSNFPPSDDRWTSTLQRSELLRRLYRPAGRSVPSLTAADLSAIIEPLAKVGFAEQVGTGLRFKMPTLKEARALAYGWFVEWQRVIRIAVGYAGGEDYDADKFEPAKASIEGETELALRDAMNALVEDAAAFDAAHKQPANEPRNEIAGRSAESE